VKSIVLSDMGIYDEALENINKAISLNPQKGDYYFTKIKYCVCQRKRNEAIECFKEGLKIEKNMFNRWPGFATLFEF